MPGAGLWLVNALLSARRQAYLAALGPVGSYMGIFLAVRKPEVTYYGALIS